MNMSPALSPFHCPSPSSTADVHDSEDALLACILIWTWSLRTGKVLRADLPAHELPTDELMRFWADDAFETR